MKKYFLALLIAFVGHMAAIADSGIRVTQGEKKFLKAAEGNAVLTFDYDGATYANKEPLTSKFNNLEELKKVGWNGFATIFNERVRKVKVVEDGAEARYKFSMKVTNMDQYFKITGFIPSNATKVWGVMTITDLSSGEVLASIEISEVDGGANPSPSGSFSDCFEELAKQVSKLR